MEQNLPLTAPEYEGVNSGTLARLAGFIAVNYPDNMLFTRRQIFEGTEIALSTLPGYITPLLDDKFLSIFHQKLTNGHRGRPTEQLSATEKLYAYTDNVESWRVQANHYTVKQYLEKQHKRRFTEDEVQEFKNRAALKELGAGA
jgi:hypothetical protein